MASEKYDRLIEEIGGVRNAVEELYLVLEYMWRNRDELREILNLEKVPDRSQEPEIPESISCDTCDAMADSLQEALHARWIDLNEDLDGRSWNYLGTCPACQMDDEEEFYRLNPHVKREPTSEAPSANDAPVSTESSKQGELF